MNSVRDFANGLVILVLAVGLAAGAGFAVYMHFKCADLEKQVCPCGPNCPCKKVNPVRRPGTGDLVP